MTLVGQLTLAFQAVGTETKKKSMGTTTPPSGLYIEPQGILGSSGATPTKSKLHFVPIDIGPKAFSCAGYIFNISTGYTGGVAVSLIAGVYGCLDTGMPDIATGPLAQATYDLSGTVASGIKQKSWAGGNYTLKPGRYWIAVIYTWATTVPTAGQLSCYSNTTYRIPTTTTLAPGSSVRSLCGNVNTYTALPTSGVTMANSSSTECPCVGLVAA